MIHIVFVRSRGLLAWTIQTVTWSHFNHVAFELPDGRQFAADSRNGVGFYAPDPAEAVARFRAPGIGRAFNWALRQGGKPYDWPGVLGVGLHRDWRAPDSWFCSELVAAAFESVGRPLLRTDRLNRITPRDLALSPLLSPV